MENYTNSITRQCHEKILEQMNNAFYKINKNNKVGFFCYLKYEDKDIPVIIINDYISNDKFINAIDIKINNEIKEIALDNIIYKNKNYNLTILKIKHIINDIKFIEIDNKIYENDCKGYFYKEPIYLLQFAKSDNIFVSYGQIKQVKNTELLYSGNISLNSEYSLIFDLNNNKLIGIHINKSKYNYNNGLFFKLLKYKINEFINKQKYMNKFKYECKYKYYKNNINEINIFMNIDKNEINKEIYFLDNYELENNKNNKNILHNNLKELSSSNTEIYINNKKEEFKKYFIPSKIGTNIINIKFNKDLTNCNYMFAGCKNIIKLNFISFNTKNIKYMKYMFYNCKNLKEINLSSFDTQKVIDMSYMFSECINMKSLDLTSFDTKNVVLMNHMFNNCKLLKHIVFYNWDTSNVINMSYIFSNCQSLNGLQNISKWITDKVNDMSYMFFNCQLLEKFPDISNWNTKNVIKMEHMFNNCELLKRLPDISKWDTKNVSYMNYIFCNCKSLYKLPDISKWNTENVENISHMFSDCHSLDKLPDISKWDTKNIIDMSYLFNNCFLLDKLPDISKWNTGNVKNMSCMFYDCYSLNHFPSVSKWDIRNLTNIEDMFHNCEPKIIPKNFYIK